MDTNKNAYFLSHCHTDHTEGLYRFKLVNDMARNGAKIYMTEESMKIVIYEAEKKRNYEIGDSIQSLKLGVSQIYSQP
ncbi:hypothetical protein O3G_MSEX014815 [Manduca sexta]|nr:hypothetical protein O3G_MSEX014815 [Manduca sexta]